MGRELKEKESQIVCCIGDLFYTHVKRRTGTVLGQCCPRSPQQPAHALPEGGTHRQDMTQNMRCAEVCCICKTTGILGEACSVSLACLQALPACLPGSAQRRGKHKWVYLCDPMPGYACEEGTDKRQGRWVNCMSQGTSGEWETDKPLGQFRACRFSGSRL